jgi:hypothetical protein
VSEKEGEIDLVLYFADMVSQRSKSMFQNVFEEFLEAGNVRWKSYPPVVCECGYRKMRAEVVRWIIEERGTIFCSNCGKGLPVAASSRESVIADAERQVIDRGKTAANMRTRFETSLSHLLSFLRNEKLKRPSCFISYAWARAL